MSNVYYEPNDFGLELVCELEYSSGHYEFDTRCVWRHTETGRLYTARDSGCSCPSPFEDCRTIDDLQEYGSFVADEVKNMQINVVDYLGRLPENTN